MFVAPLTLTSRCPGDNCDRWRTESPQTSLYWGNYCSDQDASPETDREPSLLRKTMRKYTIDLIKNVLLQYHPYTVACGSLGTPCRICENVNNFNKIREIIQNVIFYLVLSWVRCFLLEHQWMFEPFLIVVFESLNCPQCEKMDLKHTVTAGKGSNMQKMLENCRIYRTWRICLKNSAQFNCSEQTRDSWTTSYFNFSYFFLVVYM